MSQKVSCSSAICRCLFIFAVMNKVMGLIGGKVVMTAANSTLSTSSTDRNVTLLHISRHTGISLSASHYISYLIL